MDENGCIISLMLDFVPYLGFGKMVLEIITGQDLVTGDEYSIGQRVFMVFCGWLQLRAFSKTSAGQKMLDSEYAKMFKESINNILKKSDEYLAHSKWFNQYVKVRETELLAELADDINLNPNGTATLGGGNGYSKADIKLRAIEDAISRLASIKKSKTATAIVQIFSETDEGVKYLIKHIDELVECGGDYKKINKYVNKLLQTAKKESPEVFESVVTNSNLYNHIDNLIVDGEYLGRMDLAGQSHPMTGILFNDKGFPVFDEIYFDGQLDPERLLMTRPTHFSDMDKKLYQAIKSDSKLKSEIEKIMTPKQIDNLAKGKHPNNLTWHHHQDTGRMQLVNRTIHDSMNHNGGFSIWGVGN